MLMQLWRTEFELDGINCNIAYQQGYIIESEREIVQQLCAK